MSDTVARVKDLRSPTVLHASLLMAVCAAGQADQRGNRVPDAAEAEKLQQQKWNEFYAEQAAAYTISVEGDASQSLELQPKPMLYWSNPVRGGETNGAVFVWTRAGRAELVGTVFTHLAGDDSNRRVIAHSFHSLSLTPLATSGNSPSRWTFPRAGIELFPVPDAPRPAATAPLRLVQMRDLARDFAASTNLDGVEQDLRLLSNPIYRNEQTSDDVLDGGLFTFVTGTDPELMLLIEARNTNDGPHWQYATGRFTDLPLTLRHKDLVLWTREYVRGTDDERDPYFTTRLGTRARVIE